jgi:actin related protein 2/3 complex subunit 1A/1B
LPFGTVCGEYSAGGWVHSVAFSPSGTHLAFCAHDSSVTIASGAQQLQVIFTSLLPFVSLVWTGDSAIVAAGHDCAPYLFQSNGQSWY